MLKVKICGFLSEQDAILACQSGADLLGFNFYEKSPRYISAKNTASITRQLPASVSSVGIFVGTNVDTINHICQEAGIDIAQIHDSQSLSYQDYQKLQPKVIQAFRVDSSFSPCQIRKFYEHTGVNTFIFDAFQKDLYGGTGKQLDLELAKRVLDEISDFGYGFLAGGLNEKNVGQTVRKLKPYGVDVASGIEIAPGQKSHEKMAKFIREAKQLICTEQVEKKI